MNSYTNISAVKIRLVFKISIWEKY